MFRKHFACLDIGCADIRIHLLFRQFWIISCIFQQSRPVHILFICLVFFHFIRQFNKTKVTFKFYIRIQYNRAFCQSLLSTHTCIVLCFQVLTSVSKFDIMTPTAATCTSKKLLVVLSEKEPCFQKIYYLVSRSSTF